MVRLRRKPTACVIDDSEDAPEFFAEVLHAADFSAALTGIRVLGPLFEGTTPDIVLLDVVMPVPNWATETASARFRMER